MAATLTTLPLPQATVDPNSRMLAGFGRARLSGITGATVTFPAAPVPETLLVYRNGLLLDPSTVSVLGSALTLPSALVSADVLVVVGHWRP